MSHKVLFLACVGALAAGTACSGYGQTTTASPKPTTSANAKAKRQTLQTVFVTGTHITESALATETPVVKVTEADIADTGLASIGDVLQQLPMSGVALNTKFNSAGNFGFPPNGTGIGAGATTLGLRNLGPGRTLVLVDGLPFVNGSSASGVPDAVDLNTIPVGIIDNIQVLTNGASAIYGSEAIGGVVNIITRQAQNGLAAHVYFGNYQVGNGKTYSGDVSFGASGDKYNFYVDVSHYKQDRIFSSSAAKVFPAADQCVAGTSNANCSSIIPFTRTIFSAENGNDFGGLCPDGICDVVANKVSPVGAVQPFPSGFHQFTNDDRFNYASYNELLTPSKRNGLFTNLTYALTDNINFYLRGLYSTRTSVNESAPMTIFFGPAFCASDVPCGLMSVDETNPFNPFGTTLSASDPNMGVARRMIEQGPRIFEQHVNTRYIATGLRGSFGIGERDFQWDVNVVRSTNDAVQHMDETDNLIKVQEAIGPLGVCDAIPGCVPLDLFGGPGTVTPQMLKFISYNRTDSSHQYLGVESADLSGDLLHLPAGWLDFAVGYERKSLSGNYIPDSVVASREDSNETPSLPIFGSYNVSAYYAELSVPLLADLPGAKSLSVDLASRYSRYSTFGGTTSSKAGFRWAPTSDITFRGTWGQGFRAPAIGELFGEESTFSDQIEDPCDFNSGLASSTVADNCRALGVPNPSTFEQPNPQIPVQTGGNGNLRPETSRDLTLGVVYSPQWAANKPWSQRLDLRATHYKIELQNAIEAPDVQSTVDQCALTLKPIFCSGVIRNGAGVIATIQDRLENLGRLDTDGFDLGMDWVSEMTRWGIFGVSLNGTYVSHFESVNAATGQIEPNTVGVEVANSSIPRVRANARLQWRRGRWSAAWTVRYFSALTEDCGSAAGFPICQGAPTPAFPDGRHHLGATAYNDFQVSWKVPTKLPVSISAGVNNAFGRNPPLCVTCTLNGYDASTYDLPGRFYFASVTIRSH